MFNNNFIHHLYFGNYPFKLKVLGHVKCDCRVKSNLIGQKFISCHP